MSKSNQSKNSEKIPSAMQDIFDKITQRTDAFCKQHLNDEYASLFRKMTAVLCRKRPSPLMHGREQTWVAGIAHAIGMVNFLFDKSNNPHISSKDLAAYFGLTQATIANKSKEIRDLLKIKQFDLNWTLPSKMEDCSIGWMISYNGIIIDVRTLSLDIQIAAFKKGLIPYVPALKDLTVFN